jgi:predicted RNA-binding protein YlxR (DUF448 family)
MPSSNTTDPVRNGARRRAAVRTCVGCRRTAESYELVRVVLGPDGAVVPDLAGHSFGRGAWLHARPECLAEAAPRGLSRSLHAPVKTSALELWAMLRAAAERRVGALLSAAWRARKLATGNTQAHVAVEAARAELLIVATDARAVARLPWVEQAVAQGRALAWGTKDLLGSCARRSETGVVAVLDGGFADALRAAIAMDQLALPQAARRSRRSSAQRLTEDR